MKVLYLSYDGLTDPLGQSQILPYIAGLAARGHALHVISFEKKRRLAQLGDGIRSALGQGGIAWAPESYTKRPPVLSTAWDLVRFHRAARRLHERERFDLVHCRSYIPALVGLRLKRRTGVPFLFDMRGFWPDEKVDSGAWPQRNPLYAAVYRYFKRRERELLREASGIVVLSHRGKKALLQWPAMQGSETPTFVIPCSVDFSEFRPDAERKRRVRELLGIPPSVFVLGYAGSLGSWYMLPEMLDFFALLRRRLPDARFLVLTPDIAAAVERRAAERRIPAEAVIVRSATWPEVARLLSAADAGICFVEPLPSKVSSSPTKIGEYLALGLPVVTNSGIGDVDEIVAESQGGVVIGEFSHDAYERGVTDLERLRGMQPLAIHARAREIYDMTMATDRFAELYHVIHENTR